MKDYAPLVVVGVLFGFSLSRIGFTSWDEVHNMFTFADLRLVLAFAIAVGVLALSWIVLAKLTGATWSPRNVHPGTVVGGLLFGAGWALCGACPSIALVQLGELQIGGLATLTGIVLGNYAYARVHERWFRWTTGSCADV